MNPANYTQIFCEPWHVYSLSFWPWYLRWSNTLCVIYARRHPETFRPGYGRYWRWYKYYGIW